MKQKIHKILTDILSEMGVVGVDPEVEISDAPEHGDYTTNIAMKLSGTLKKSPTAIGQEIVERLEKNKALKKEGIGKIDVMPPGFINLFVTDEALLSNLTKSKALKTKKHTIMVEYAQPNTHKTFHIGHLRNITTGESIVRLLEANGNKVIRVNYQGDVGLHIAKAMYGLVKYIIDNKNNNSSQSFTQNDLEYVDRQIQQIESHPLAERIELLSKAYVIGNQAFETNLRSKKAVNEINKVIYSKESSGIFSRYYSLYQQTRQWSLDYFDTLYKKLGTHFDHFYFESEVYELGKQLVLEGMEKGIFEKSEGAIIFPGKKFGLHNRVFITSEGNPTYEGKDIGLSKLQFGDYHPDTIIHCVSTEQIEYFKVIFEAIARVFPDTRGKEYHLPYGFVQLKSGKMSSRTGNVVLGEWLLDETKKEIQKILKTGGRAYEKGENDTIAEIASVAAVKYAFLKVSTTQEIAFDIKESINLNGDSGPYLLYTYARCKSVMEKYKEKTEDRRQKTEKQDQTHPINKEEHDLARLLFYFPEIIEDAGKHFAPNTLCSYLFNLAQAFNLLYAKHPILGNDLRLMLTEKTATTLKEGLRLLGIETVERM